MDIITCAATMDVDLMKIAQEMRSKKCTIFMDVNTILQGGMEIMVRYDENKSIIRIILISTVLGLLVLAMYIWHITSLSHISYLEE